MDTSMNYVFNFCDKNLETTVTTKASVADNWVTTIHYEQSRRKTLIGFDCKFKPHPIRSMSNKIATLQLCVDTKCLILQLLYLDEIPKSIRSLLTDPDITFVGIEIHENVSKLWSEYGLNCDKKVDVRSLMKIWYPISHKKRPGLKAMVYTVVGIPMRKLKRKFHCDWESSCLDEELIEYASVDAYCCYEIVHRLLN